MKHHEGNEMKIGFIGLDGSGKSAFLAGLREEYSTMLDPLPTKSMVQETINILGQEFTIYEYGGGKTYRDQYLRDIKANFGELDVIFFFFAIKDPNRINEGTQYLQNILKGLPSLHSSKVVICCHFVDPDIKSNASIRQTVAQIETAVQGVNDGIVAFEETSIFDIKSLHRAFAHGIQKIASKEDLIYEKLENFANETSTAGLLLLDDQAITIASYVSDEDTDYVLESCISFVEAWKSISIRQMIPGQLSIEVSKGKASLYPLNSPTGLIFLIVYSKSVESGKAVTTRLPSFIEDIQDLLTAFFN